MLNIKTEEKVSFYTHFISIFATLIGIFFLLLRTNNITQVTLILIYGISVTLLFSCSSLYHKFKKKENENSIWRKLDHLAIFIMIAGTYTPVCFYYLKGAWLYSILGVQWGLVFFGFFFKFFFLKAPRVLYTSIYLMMGWMALVPIHQFYTNMSSEVFATLIAGALFYTTGAVIYAMKKPTIKEGLFGFHEIFHIFIIFGTICHYFMVYLGFETLLK